MNSTVVLEDNDDPCFCARCEAVGAKLFSSPTRDALSFLDANESFSIIENSASRGCRFCILLLDAVTGERYEPDLPYPRKCVTLRAVCRAVTDADYYASCISRTDCQLAGVGCTERSHTQAIEVCHGDLRICYLRYVFEGYRLERQPDLEQSRTLRERADDPSNFEMITKWLEECTKNHKECMTNLVSNFTLPARLIDVSPEDGDVDVRLVEISNQQTQTRHSYAVLSHCWGPDPDSMFKTTASNLQEMLKGVKWDVLPKTFQDAISTTRQLRIRGKKIRYLWIDALCIIQGDPKDFEREGTVMHKIYSMATCTIAASASADSSGGCIVPRGDSPRGIPRSKPCRMKCGGQDVTIFPWSSEWENAHCGPLSSRGWSFQELELSRRTLHFTANRIFWECRTAIASEDHPEMITVTKYLVHLPSSAEPRRLVQRVNRGVVAMDGLPYKREKSTELWCEAVQQYTRRRLSYRNDRLPAIYGIATILSGHVQDDYISGLWPVDFARGASWVRDSSFSDSRSKSDTAWPPPLADPTQPSWSWASIDGPVLYPFLENFDTGGYLDDNGSHVNLHDLDGGEGLNIKYEKGHLRYFTLEVQNVSGRRGPFGSFANSEVLVRGVMINITLSEADCIKGVSAASSGSKVYHMFGKPLFRFGSASQSNTANGCVWFDFDPVKLVKQEFVCLRLGKRTTATTPYLDVQTYVGLVLQPLKRLRTNQLVFRRVGVFEVDERNSRYEKKVRLQRCILV